MSKDGRGFDPHKLLGVGMVVVAAVVVALLVLNIYTVRRVSYLDTYFTNVSEDYRAVRSGLAVAAAPGAAPTPAAAPVADDSGRMCVTGELDFETDPFIGDADAPVVIVEYSDFECPFCARYFFDAYQQVKEQYIDTGLARLYFKDFPLDNIHPQARPAAVAANCIYENEGAEAFFAFHDRLFETQDQWNSSVAALESLALEGGITAAELTACQDDGAFSAEITADLNEGQSVGVNGTPSFVINGELVIGAQPFSEFQRAIESALAGEGCQG